MLKKSMNKNKKYRLCDAGTKYCPSYRFYTKKGWESWPYRYFKLSRAFILRLSPIANEAGKINLSRFRRDLPNPA